LSQHEIDLMEKFMSNPDRKINLKDIPEIAENTFANRSGILSLGLFKPYKQQITLRLDSDILAWARRDGAGYQSRINGALRKAMLEDMKGQVVKPC
jgi:uncharacterized protein (DUF4415 family)